MGWGADSGGLAQLAAIGSNAGSEHAMVAVIDVRRSAGGGGGGVSRATDSVDRSCRPFRPAAGASCRRANSVDVFHPVVARGQRLLIATVQCSKCHPPGR